MIPGLCWNIVEEAATLIQADECTRQLRQQGVPLVPAILTETGLDGTKEITSGGGYEASGSRDESSQ